MKKVFFIIFILLVSCDKERINNLMDNMEKNVSGDIEEAKNKLFLPSE